MPTFLSEDLGDPEVVHDGATNLTGYAFTSTGVEARYVALRDGGATVSMIVVPAGTHVGVTGLLEPYPGGLSVESLQGDGTLIANIYYSISSPEESDDAGE